MAVAVMDGTSYWWLASGRKKTSCASEKEAANAEVG
jgi:hypothetical protein